LGDLQGARQLGGQAVAGLHRVLGEDHPNTLTAMENFAKVLRALGEL
jgi:Tetratricopeptide repeat